MMSTHKVHESLVADSLASKAGWSGLSQNSSDFKSEHLPQRKDSVTNDPAPETGKPDRKSTRLNSSHITRSRMPSSA